MMRRFCLAVTLLLAAIGPARAEWHAREEAIMGTRIAVEVWHEDAAAAEAAIEAVIAEMHRIDALMSTYKPESQLSLVNREAAAGPVTVDPELARLVARALEFSAMSGGAFDITYASIGYLYDYRAGRARRLAASSAPRTLEVSFMLSFLCRAHPDRPRAGRQVPGTADGR